jgi:hypothetical protein
MASADLVIAFDARIGNLEAALRRTETSLRRTEQQAKETGSAMAAALTAGASSAGNSLLLLSRNLLGVGLGFLALQRAGQAIGGALSAIDALADEAASIGATTNQLRALQVAFEEAGGNGDKAADAFGKLNNIIGQAGDGTESAINRFASLGVAFRNTDGTLRGSADVFDDIIEKLQGMESAAEQMAVAQEFFGRGAARTVIAALGEMEGGLTAVEQRLRDMGAALGDETPQRLDALGTAFANLGRVLGSAIANAIAYVSPVIVSFLEWLTARVADAIRFIERVVLAVERMARRIGQAFGVITTTPLEAAERNLQALETRMQGTLQQEQRLLAAQQNAARDPDSYAARLNATNLARVQEEARTATDAIAIARRELAGLRRDAELPTPPTVPPLAAAPPQAVGGGGGGSTQVDEMIKMAERLYEQTRTPLERFRIESSQAVAIWNSRNPEVQAALGGFDTIQRAVVEYAENAYQAQLGLGRTSAEAQAAIQQSITATGELLVGRGALSWEQWAQVATAANAAVGRAADDTAKRTQQSIDSAAGAINGALSSSFVALGTGAATIEDTWKKLLSNILQTVIQFVYEMTIQAAILRLLKSAFSAFGGAFTGTSDPTPIPGGGGGLGLLSFSGFSETSGALLGDGEAATFASSLTAGGGAAGVGRGLVTVEPRQDTEVNVAVYNNSSNTTTRQQERTNGLGGKEVDIYIENVVRQGLMTGRYDNVMGQSFGASRRGVV